MSVAENAKSKRVSIAARRVTTDPRGAVVDCVAWMFRASHLRCHTFTGRLAVDACTAQDCFIGLVDDRLEGAIDRFRRHFTAQCLSLCSDIESLIEKIDAIVDVPAERYRGTHRVSIEADGFSHCRSGTDMQREAQVYNRQCGSRCLWGCTAELLSFRPDRRTCVPSIWSVITLSPWHLG